MRIFTAAEAKQNFGVLVDAARIAPVAVTKYHRSFVVVMAAEEFERLTERKIGKQSSRSPRKKGKT